MSSLTVISSKKNNEAKTEFVNVDLSLKKKAVLTDWDRMMFNVDTLMIEFKREARRKEALSLKARRQCRHLLEVGRYDEARDYASRDIKAKNITLACTVACRRMSEILELVKEEMAMNKSLRPHVSKALKNLDFAVRTVDVQVVQDAIKKLEECMGVKGTEVSATDMEAEGEVSKQVEKDESIVISEEIDKYISQMEEEIAILSQLKEENGWKGRYRYPRKHLSSASHSTELTRNASTFYSKPNRRSLSFID